MENIYLAITGREDCVDGERSKLSTLPCDDMHWALSNEIMGRCIRRRGHFTCWQKSLMESTRGGSLCAAKVQLASHKSEIVIGRSGRQPVPYNPSSSVKTVFVHSVRYCTSPKKDARYSSFTVSCSGRLHRSWRHYCIAIKVDRQVKPNDPDFLCMPIGGGDHQESARRERMKLMYFVHVNCWRWLSRERECRWHVPLAWWLVLYH